MKGFLMLLFALLALWDAFTTFLGTYEIAGKKEDSLVFSIVAAVVVLAFMFGSTYIFEIGGFIGRCLKGLWIAAFLVDVITAFRGNSEFINTENGLLSWVIVLLMTILTCASGVIVSYMHRN